MLVALFSLNLFSQQQSFVNNLSFKLSYGIVNSEPFNADLTGEGTPVFIREIGQMTRSNFGLDLNYALAPSSDIGLYFGYSQLYRINVVQMEDQDSPRWYYALSPTITFYYGLNYIYHLPWITNYRNSRLDIYTILKAGLVSEKYYSDYDQTGYGSMSGYGSRIWDKPALEAGAGLGVNYYFTKNLGVFGEVLGGSFYNEQYFKWKAGFVIRF